MNPELYVPEENRPIVTVNILTDNIFLEVFAFCLSDKSYKFWFHMAEWQRLVQVCQRWRQIIYGLPHYLDLHLYCSDTAAFSFRKNHSHWPDFPLTLRYRTCYRAYLNNNVDDLILSTVITCTPLISTYGAWAQGCTRWSRRCKYHFWHWHI